MPQVSVVLPVFNAAHTIERAVRSILDQTLRELELIVVDDGSLDDTAASLERIQDSRLRRVRRSHQGVVAAANAATELASAPFIARMDADDFAHPHRLERQLKFLLEHDLDVVGCQVRVLNESGNVVPSLSRYARWINNETIDCENILALRFVELPIVNPTILARREYFEMGFRDNGLPEDYDLMLRGAASGMRFGKTPEVLFDWIDHSARLTRTDSRYSDAAFNRCRQSHLLQGPLTNTGIVDLWGVGKTGKPWLCWLQAQGITIRRCYDIDERKIDALVHGVRVTHASRLSHVDSVPILIAVGSEGARDVIRPQLEAAGYEVGKDAWFVA